MKICINLLLLAAVLIIQSGITLAQGDTTVISKLPEGSTSTSTALPPSKGTTNKPEGNGGSTSIGNGGLEPVTGGASSSVISLPLNIVVFLLGVAYFRKHFT